MRFVLRTVNCVITKKEISLCKREILYDIWELCKRDILNMSLQIQAAMNI